MTNSKIVQLAKILTNAANSDMRKARASLKRNLKLQNGVYVGHTTITGTAKGNIELEVNVADRWNIRCSGGAGDFLINGDEDAAREFLIDCYVIVDESESAVVSPDGCRRLVCKNQIVGGGQ